MRLQTKLATGVATIALFTSVFTLHVSANYSQRDGGWQSGGSYTNVKASNNSHMNGSNARGYNSSNGHFDGNNNSGKNDNKYEYENDKDYSKYLKYMSRHDDHTYVDKDKYKDYMKDYDRNKDYEKDKNNHDYDKHHDGYKKTSEHHAWLVGSEEVPGPGDSDGKGHAKVTLNLHKNELCAELHVAYIQPATAAHVHEGDKGVAGPVVVPLPTPNQDGYTYGCVNVDHEKLKNISHNASHYYVNVHNNEYPNGAIRGQLSM